MKGLSFDPKWLLASLGISAGKWSTLWKRIQCSFARDIFSSCYPFMGSYTKKGSSIDVNLFVNSIDP